MEVADRVVVMNKGRVEQIAGPRELYDAPANDFVMTFVGDAVVFDGELVRPHDLEVRLDGEGLEAQVVRLVHLGFGVRCELATAGEEQLTVMMTRDHAELLELEPGQIVSVRGPGVGIGSERAHVVG